MNLRSAILKLELAINILSSGPGHLRERLWYTYFHLQKINSEDFPCTFRHRFLSIMGQLTKKESCVAANGQMIDSIQNTLDSMSSNECIGVSEMIINLFYDLKLYSMESIS